MYQASIRKEAEALRSQGKTYTEIAETLKIAKGTVSLWLRALPFPKRSTAAAKKTYFLTHVQAKGAAANRAKKEAAWRAFQAEAAAAVSQISADDSELSRGLLAVLYWAEGTKFDRGGMVFTNTDPRLACLFLTLLRKAYSIDESRLRVRLHLHDYHDQQRAVAYWSQILSIPTAQFQSTYIKRRNPAKKFRQNFMGICFIKYGDSNIRRKMLSYAYALQARLAPVAQLD